MASYNRVLSTCLAVWFAISQALWGIAPAYAQSGAAIDLDPPLIEHEIISEVESSARQTFVATVVDDDELESVRLFYRFTGEPTYSSTLMNRVSFSSSYIAQINTDPNTATTIEYYIQARDVSGNRTVRGYAFNPLMRSIVTDEEAVANNAADPNLQKTAATEAPKTRKTIYIVLGVFALGLLAGLSSGGSGGGGSNCDNTGCRIDINVDTPAVSN